MTLAMLIQGKRNIDHTRLANANLAKVAKVPVNSAHIESKLAGLATLAIAEAENHMTITPSTREPATSHGTANIVRYGTIPKAIWRNQYPKGTPEARAETIRVIEAARRGAPI